MTLKGLKVKGQGHQVDQCCNWKLAISSEREGLGTSIFVHGWSTMICITGMCSDLKGQRSRSQGRLTPWPKISYIFGTRRPKNFNLGIRIEYDDPHHQHAWWPPNWKLWVALQVTTYRPHSSLFSLTMPDM